MQGSQVLKGKIFFSFLFMFFLCFNLSFAQAADLFIKASNDSPKEGETVKLTLNSNKYDLNKANIIWYIDGNEEDSGVGRRTFSVLMTNKNPVQIIAVSVQEEGLNDAAIQVILQISEDVFLYEGYNSQTPLFYKGRSLPGKEGSANAQIISFKNGEIVSFNDNQNTNYIWKVNGEDRNSLTGISKTQNILNAGLIDDNLSVQVQMLSANTGKTLSLNVPLQTQEVLLYRQSEDKLLQRLITDTEATKSLNIKVEPFFFSTSNRYSNDLKYTWKINNIESSISTPWFVSFSGDKRETVKIDLDISNKNKITQKVKRSFNFKVE